jgi:hypothetical protein
MTRSRLLLLSLFVLSAAVAEAKPVKEFTEPNTIVFEQKKKKLSSYAENPEYGPQEEPFPWLFLGLGLLLIAGAAPFAFRAFRQVEQDHLEQLEANVTEGEKRAAAKQMKQQQADE